MRLIYLLICLFLTSCEGIIRMQIYNFSEKTVLIKTSLPRSGLSEELLNEYPNMRLKPLGELTKSQRIDYLKNLFHTKDSLIEDSKELRFILLPKHSIMIGARRFIFYPRKIKGSDLFIDTLTIFCEQDSSWYGSRREILSLKKNRQFKCKKTDRKYYNIEKQDIVIRKL